MLFVVIISLIGDSIILLASIKYNAFKLHKIIVVLIQHIAANDLLYSLASITPAMLSAFYNTGSPYRFLDFVRFFFNYYTAAISSVLVCVMTLGKVLLVKYPFRVGFMSARKAHKICAVIWILCIYVPALNLAIDKEDVSFDFRTYYCTYSYTSKIWKILLPIQAFIVLLLPNTIVITSTIILLRTAKKAAKDHRRSLRWQGITTVCLNALIYTMSFLPYNLYFIAQPFVDKNPQNPGPFYLEYFKVANAFIILHVLSNFFVYSLTVESFRRFLLTEFQKAVPIFSNKISQQGNFLYTDRWKIVQVTGRSYSDFIIVLSLQILSFFIDKKGNLQERAFRQVT